MKSMYMLESGIKQGSEATKNFFSKVKVFHVGKKKNGHFIFVDVNNHNNWLETSTGEITENSNNYKRIVTRNSVINIIKIS